MQRGQQQEEAAEGWLCGVLSSIRGAAEGWLGYAKRSAVLEKQQRDGYANRSAAGGGSRGMVMQIGQQREEPVPESVMLVLGAQSGYSSREKIGIPTVADHPMVANIVIIVIPAHNNIHS